MLYIDLKSENPIGCEKKFKSMRQFIRYAINLIDEFHGQDLKIVDERYIILFGGVRPHLRKMPTVIKSGGSSKSTPSKPFKKYIDNGVTIPICQIA